MDRMHMFTPQEILNIPVSGVWTPLLAAQSFGSAGLGTNSCSVKVEGYNQIGFTVFFDGITPSNITVVFDNFDYQNGGGNIHNDHNMKLAANQTYTLSVPKGAKYFSIRTSSTSYDVKLWVVGM